MEGEGGCEDAHTLLSQPTPATSSLWANVIVPARAVFANLRMCTNNNNNNEPDVHH